MSRKYETTITFEPTAIGTVARKTFLIQNGCSYKQSYTVKRDPTTNPVDHVFDVKLARGSVKPQQMLECVLVYEPHFPNERNVDYFQIIDDDETVYNICVKGESLGPVVMASTHSLVFYNTGKCIETKHTFELTNTSNIQTKYQFDHLNDQCVFNVDNICGVLEARKHVYITIRFTANKPGVYSLKLPCVILYHEPIIIELTGLCSFKDKLGPGTEMVTYIQPIGMKQGYSGYLVDTVNMSDLEPPISFSENNLDFGFFNATDENDYRCVLVTCLTNHLGNDIRVNWDIDDRSSFYIQPEQTMIPPNESVLYECKFKPTKPHTLYASKLHGRVFWNMEKSENSVGVPLPITLQMMGHTFPSNHGWIPNVRLQPAVVVMPPCIPPFPIYTTFCIQNISDLPVMYKFLPPKKTNYVLKPMQGVITTQFQIVVVQMYPDFKGEKAYIERWDVQLNGRDDKTLSLFLKGYAEYPFLDIGYQGTVSFGTVFPGCEAVEKVEMRNTTRHCLRYNFQRYESEYIQIENPVGDIESNETVYLEWRYKASFKLPDIFDVKCEVFVLRGRKAIIGFPVNVLVQVRAKCVYSELCVMPNSYDFQTIQYGIQRMEKFYIFNFGESNVHFMLNCENDFAAEKGLYTDTVQMQPMFGTLEPRNKIPILVTITAKYTGFHKFNISYSVRINESSAKTVGKEKHLFSLQYYCAYPILQVVDLFSNTTPLFSKIDLWEMLNIDTLNKILKLIEHDENKVVDMNIPAFLVMERFSVILTLQNVSEFSTSCIMKRLHLCKCKPIRKPKGMSFTELVYDCPHRKLISAKLYDNDFEVKTNHQLTINVNFESFDSQNLAYNLELSDHRVITINFKMKTLPKNNPSPVKYSQSYNVDLRDVYIGERDPSCQIFWLYNNSCNITSYKLDTTQFGDLRKFWSADVITCLNPQGGIVPSAAHPLMFKFKPIQMRKYEIQVPLHMGMKMKMLTITGNGSISYNSHIYKMLGHMPPTTNFIYPDKNPITLSTDHIVLKPFTTFSKNETLIFMKNTSKNRVMAYIWERCLIKNTLNVHVSKQYGLIKPKELLPFRISVKSFNEPCILRIRLPLILYDLTQDIIYCQSVGKYNAQVMALHDYFTITEKGISYPEPNVKIEDPPKMYYTSLSISLHIVSCLDIDLKIKIADQMKLFPKREFLIDKKRIYNEISEMYKTEGYVDDQVTEQKPPIKLEWKKASMIHNVLECLMWDAVFNDGLKHTIQLLNEQPVPYYSQVIYRKCQHPIICRAARDKERDHCFCPCERLVLIGQFLHKLPTNSMSRILREMILESVHEHFGVGPVLKEQRIAGLEELVYKQSVDDVTYQ